MFPVSREKAFTFDSHVQIHDRRRFIACVPNSDLSFAPLACQCAVVFGNTKDHDARMIHF